LKTFHILNIGASIITNYTKAGRVENRLVSDNEYRGEKLNASQFLLELYDLSRSDPRKNSAELNSFLRIAQYESQDSRFILWDKS
jgi:CRISPR/Cas system-associated protein Csm6